MSRRKKRKSKDSLESLKIATAKARLAKLEAELPATPLKDFIRYEDLPPLMPEDREWLKEDLLKQLTIHEEEIRKREYDWYMSMAHWAP